MRSILPSIRHALETRYRLDVLAIERVWSGTSSVHARADTTTGPVFAKTYPLRGDDANAILNITVQHQWRHAGIPTIAPITAPDGTLLHRQPGLVLSVWDWTDAQPVRPLTLTHAPAIGQTLARLHQCLDRLAIAGLPFNPETARNTARPNLLSRFETLDQRLADQSRPDRTALHTQIRHRIRLLAQVPQLRAGLSPMRLDRVHGDLTPPNLLWTGPRLTAVIDPQIQLADRARELGRIAFDPGTVATGAPWQDIGLAVVSAYIDAGGPLGAPEILSCARLALLHSLTSAYPLTDMIAHEPPSRTYDQHRTYWNQRCATIDRMLDLLPEVENQLQDLTNTAIPAGMR